MTQKPTLDLHWLNLLIVVLMCSTTLSPALMLFYYNPGTWMFGVGFVIILLVLARVPPKYYKKLQASDDIKWYKAAGIHTFKKYATNGDFINAKIRKKLPAHRIISGRESILEQLEDTYRIEQTHFLLFVLCLMTAALAFYLKAFATTILITVGNVIFNVYPILLQQYNRLRYQRALERQLPRH